MISVSKKETNIAKALLLGLCSISGLVVAKDNTLVIIVKAWLRTHDLSQWVCQFYINIFSKDGLPQFHNDIKTDQKWTICHNLLYSGLKYCLNDHYSLWSLFWQLLLSWNDKYIIIRLSMYFIWIKIRIRLPLVQLYQYCTVV